MMIRLPIDTDPVSITDTSNGAPWWVVIILAGIVVIAPMATVWATRRRDRSTNEQAMIDQLQEEIRSLRSDLTAIRTDLTVAQNEMRTLRVRDIAWITYTSDLTRVALEAGATPPPMPTELRVPPVAAPVTA